MIKKKTRKKKKEDDQIDRLEKEIRELKAINRSLMKRLKKLDRNFKKVEDLEEELDEFYKKEDQPKFGSHQPESGLCPSCKKGKIIETDLGVRILRKCDWCKWRETKKG